MRPVNADSLYNRLEGRYKFASGKAREAYSLAIDDVRDAMTLQINHELIDLANKAVNQWRGSDTYHQASVIIDALLNEIKALGLSE